MIKFFFLKNSETSDRKENEKRVLKLFKKHNERNNSYNNILVEMLSEL